MRKELEQMEGVRTTFSAEFVRYGTKKNWHGFPEPTILLADVRDATGKKVTDHLWFNVTKGFRSVGQLLQGDKVRFDGRVDWYVKGRVDRRRYIDERTLDYRISRPTRIVKLQTASGRH